jgi:catechol 2,3-dioxygenase-like lactoylglutathione lyase family enzyme
MPILAFAIGHCSIRLELLSITEVTAAEFRTIVEFPRMYLYEAHLPVADTDASRTFYIEIVGLKFAHRDHTRDIVFLWSGEHRKSMVGLWGPNTIYGRNFYKSHIAFAMPLPDLLTAGQRLRGLGVTCTNFLNEKTDEPSVIGWMPSAQLYFNDIDGHLLEFIALLDDPPDAGFMGSLSEWRKRTG